MKPNSRFSKLKNLANQRLVDEVYGNEWNFTIYDDENVIKKFYL